MKEPRLEPYIKRYMDQEGIGSLEEVCNDLNLNYSDLWVEDEDEDEDDKQ